jgi:hypothetical protein
MSVNVCTAYSSDTSCWTVFPTVGTVCTLSEGLKGGIAHFDRRELGVRDPKMG